MKIIAKNRRAFFDYIILEKFEAGVKLLGWEVKSTKLGHISLKGSFVTVKENELYLLNTHISPYQVHKGQSYEPERTRKLLLNKAQIKKLIGKKSSDGLTIVPLVVYIKKGYMRILVELYIRKPKIFGET